MAFDRNGNDISNGFDSREPIKVGHVVWVKYNDNRLEVPGLVQSIPEKNTAIVRYLYNEQFDETKTVPFNDLRLFIANANDLPTSEYCTDAQKISLWKSAWNIGRALQRVVPMDRNRFLSSVLKRILRFDELTRMEEACHRWMKVYNLRLLNEGNASNELTDLLDSVFQSRLFLKANSQSNQNETENNAESELEDTDEDANEALNFTQIETDADKICSKCRGTGDVTKCCVHCLKHFDEACFADDGEYCSGCRQSDTRDKKIHRKCHACNVAVSGDAAHKLIRCIKEGCPVAYHKTRHCVSAGAHLLSRTQMLCPMLSRANDVQSPMTICCKRGSSLVMNL